MNEPSRELAEHIASLADGNGGLNDARLVKAIALIDNYVADAVYKEVEWWAMALVRANLGPTDIAEANARFKAVTARAMWRT